MKKLFYVLIAVMLTAAGVNAQRPQQGRMGGQQNFMAAVNMPKEDLSLAEKTWMTKIALEEKMAYDFYYMMFNKWNEPAFMRIMNAELRHKTLMVRMLEKYGLSNPIDDSKIGQYTDNGLQRTYNSLLSKGNQSLKDAMIAAAGLEEQDYMDLQQALDTTDNADLRLAFRQMKRGSANHLRAMVFQLKNLYDYDYEPQHLDKSTFDSLMQEHRGRGQRPGMRGHGRHRGPGRGYRQGGNMN